MQRFFLSCLWAVAGVPLQFVCQQLPEKKFYKILLLRIRRGLQTAWRTRLWQLTSSLIGVYIATLKGRGPRKRLTCPLPLESCPHGRTNMMRTRSWGQWVPKSSSFSWGRLNNEAKKRIKKTINLGLVNGPRLWGSQRPDNKTLSTFPSRPLA